MGWVVVALSTWMLTGIAVAEELPIERVFAPPALNGPAPRGVQLSPDGAFVTYLKPEAGDQTTYDLWALPVKGGAARRLIEGSAVEPKDVALTEAEKGRRERQRIAGNHGVVEYKWDEVGEEILIPAGGQLYLANAKSGEVRKLGDTGGAAIDAKISPKGRYVTYVRDQNLHAIDVQTGRDLALTTEGKDTLSFGVAEFVAQEEMDRYTGYWTSPDDRCGGRHRRQSALSARRAAECVRGIVRGSLGEPGRPAGEGGSGAQRRCVSRARRLVAGRQDIVRAT
jgi:dipeptidyl-peptidase-4